MGGIQRRLLKIVLAVVRYPRMTLAICAAVMAISIGAALLHLTIDTDQDRLFSSQVGFFKNYLDFINKFQENEALYVMIEPSDPKKPPLRSRWTEVADQVAAKMKTLTDVVSSVEYRTPLNSLGSYALLFADPSTVQDSFKSAQSELIPLANVWGAKPSGLAAVFGASPLQRFLSEMNLAAPDAEKAKFVQILADSWAHTIQTGKPDVPDLAALQAQTPTDLGYSYVTDANNPANHLLLVAVYLADDDSSLAAGTRQVDAVRSAAREIAPDYPDFHIAVSGRPALAADEMQTSDTDSTRAEILALTVIFASLVIVFRSFWLAAVAEISLAVAIGWTFGWATISVGQLNILSLVFLITLIGIGMDYLVQIITRFRRESMLYARPAAAWARVFKHVSPPICTACLGAAGAFFVSIFTDFRGAAELGIIASGGLLLCLASGYTVLPALLVIFPWRQAPPRIERRYGRVNRRPALARFVPPICWIVGLLIMVPFMFRIDFNPNLIDLQAQNLESVKLVRKLPTWSAVVISKDDAMLRRVRDALRSSPEVASTDSLIEAQDNYAWLKQNQSKLEAVDWVAPVAISQSDLPSIAKAANSLADRLANAHFMDSAVSLRNFSTLLVAPAQTSLTLWQSDFVAELKNLLSEFYPAPIDVNALPAQLKNHYISPDGYYALYVTPKENLWNREKLVAFVTDLETRIATVPDHPPLTGIAPQIYHSTAAIKASFLKATVYALILVLILVFLDLRNIPQTLLTVSVLGLGLPMLIGLMGLFNIKWNFANFFGLPILIGAGHEYGVFMMHRYRESMHDPRRVWLSWDVSDRALLLCAFVTTSSFAFFWALGHHEGLKSLGLVMALGTACIYLAAVLVVRPLLKWRIERAGHWAGKSGTTNFDDPDTTASAAK
jgi:predicted RND superfamily exporter protein